MMSSSPVVFAVFFTSLVGVAFAEFSFKDNDGVMTVSQEGQELSATSSNPWKIRWVATNLKARTLFIR